MLDLHSFDAAVAVARPWIREAAIREAIPGDGEGAIRLSGLLEAGRLAPVIERHRRRFGEDACPRGAASVWSKHLFSALLPFPALVALAGGQAPLDPLLAIVDGLPKAVVARPPVVPSGPPASEAFAEWIRQALGETAIVALARSSGLAARLFWSNAAAMLAYLCERWDALPPVAGRSAELRTALFHHYRLPGSADANPLAGQITYVATPVPEYPTLRRRRLCCLRDRLGQPLCASCPKITAEARDAALRAAAARAAATASSTGRTPPA